MEKRNASRQPVPILTTLFVVAFNATVAIGAVELSPAEAQRIGRKVWQNEAAGTISGLTSWNSGENFASLGIGHFIWYPEGVHGPFEESFPKLLAFVQQRGIKLPAFLARDPSQPCPWRTRAAFMEAQSSPNVRALRQFLADTVPLQAEFLVLRLERSLPKMLAEAPAAEREEIRARFNRLTRTAQGCYALVDYVNFKGEGTKESERYQGQGWGLLQVLQGMKGTGSATADFARSAKAVLTRRVKNSPSGRNEARWLPGWLKRVETYIES